MGIKKGDEVILPAFTCVVVPNAILYLEAVPVYVDIKRETYNTSLDKIKEKVTGKTKCIIIQNTFGLSSEVEEIVAYANENKLRTIEDCTHGFGGTYEGKPNGVFAEASFFSTQWNKPFSTGVGGFIYLKNKRYLSDLLEVNEKLVQPTYKEKVILGLLIKVRKFLLTPRTYWSLLRLYRFLSRKGIVVGSSSGEEITGIIQPRDYFKGYSNVQAREGIRSMKKLDKHLVLRKKNAILFNQFLQQNDKVFVAESLFNNHSFLKFPILVKDRELFKKRAEKASINLGDWFVSMIHPIEDCFDNWKLRPQEFPVADEISKQILNLDTDTQSVDKILKFLEDNKKEIL